MRWRALKYAVPLLLYYSICRSFFIHGFLIFMPLIISFGALPLLELVLRTDDSNLDEAEEAIARNEFTYDLLLYMVVPLQYTALYFFLSGINNIELVWWEKAGRTLAMGLACGTFGINVAHELGHRKIRYEQWLAKTLLLTSLYTQFIIEHNKGHHYYVSTPSDPSSAPYRMPLYSFWFRSISGVYRGAWRISNSEMKKKGLPAFHWRNEMLQLQMLTLLFLAAIIIIFGLAALPYFLAAATIGILLLETVNYIEHYGLERMQTKDGRFERTQPCHSWNSNHVLGRLMLFELSRHSDHHYLASRKYQLLRHHANAPQLPTGYPGSMLLACIPPLWFKVMDNQMKKFGITHP